MATRFGATSPAHTYQAKMRWMVGGLLAAIIILVLTLIFVVKNSGSAPPPPEQAAAAAPAQAALPAVATTVPILFASQRIEEGSRFEDFMFIDQALPVDRLPDGALKSSERQEIIGKFAKQIINSNLPVLREYVSESKPISMLNIPPGYRAVTITVDSRSGVEGFAKPNSRVDVLWSYTDKVGQRAVATIVRFVKVLSVGGLTTADGRAQVGGNQTTVTLLVSERDAKKIELARTLGALSLTLVGDTEPQMINNDTGVDVVDMNAIIGVPATADKPAEEEPAEGVMYTTDPKTGKQVRFVFRKGRWKRDEGAGE